MIMSSTLINISVMTSLREFGIGNGYDNVVMFGLGENRPAAAAAIAAAREQVRDFPLPIHTRHTAVSK